MLERPVIPELVIPAWHAFVDLSRGRTTDMGVVHGIRYSDIAAYLDFACITSAEDRAEYAFIISALDRDYLNSIREQQDGKN